MPRRESGSTAGRALRSLAGLVAGAVAGVVVTLGIVTLRTVAEAIYIHGFGDLLGWVGLPVILLPLAGAALGLGARAHTFRRVLAGAAAGLLGGAALGAVTGALVGGEPSSPWAGGILGAAAGVLLGIAVGSWGAARRTPDAGKPSPSRDGSAPRAGDALARLAPVAIAGSLLAAACGPGDPPAPQEDPPAPPAPESVESVTFLIGDPGKARELYYPILPRLRRDVERWAGALEEDSSVVALVLGDIVYPDGLHPPDHELRRRDSLRLVEQFEIISGPEAHASGARLLYIAGNHDWGQEEDFAGAVRLHRLDAFLDAWREDTGVLVDLRPEAGTGGPAVLDVGRRLRLVILDTAWWLLEGERANKEAVVTRVADAMRGAGDRHVAFAAHHPFESGGPHGTALDLGRSLGLRYVLKRAGVMLQDLDSRPYRELKEDLLDIFGEMKAPVLFAGGHEHSLQVIEGIGPRAPETTLVSGSASKLTDVSFAPGMEFGLSAPGYAKLFVKRDGTVELFVDAAPRRFLNCRGEVGEGPPPARCLAEGVEAYRTVWGGELALPGEASTTRPEESATRPDPADPAASGR